MEWNFKGKTIRSRIKNIWRLCHWPKQAFRDVEQYQFRFNNQWQVETFKTRISRSFKQSRWIFQLFLFNHASKFLNKNPWKYLGRCGSVAWRLPEWRKFVVKVQKTFEV